MLSLSISSRDADNYSGRSRLQCHPQSPPVGKRRERYIIHLSIPNSILVTDAL